MKIRGRCTAEFGQHASNGDSLPEYISATNACAINVGVILHKNKSVNTTFIIKDRKKIDIGLEKCYFYIIKNVFENVAIVQHFQKEVLKKTKDQKRFWKNEV